MGSVLVAAGTARGGGGQVALRAVLTALKNRAVVPTVVVPLTKDIRALPEGPTYRQRTTIGAIASEILGTGVGSVDLYVGMSDRLPLLRRAPVNVLVAQNPHLYGPRTERRPLRQRVRTELLRVWARSSCRRADWVVVATASSRNEVLLSVPISPDRVVVRPIPPQDVPPPLRLGVRERIERLILIGDLYLYKRFDWAIKEVDAWAEQVDRTVDVVHIGRPIQSQAVAALDRAIAGCRRARVERWGARPHDQVMSALRKADMFLFPSDRESFGLPLAEALASAVPAACRDIPQFREIGGDAVEYFTDTPGGLVGALHACEPLRVRHRMSMAGTSRVVPNGGWDVFEPPRLESHDMAGDHRIRRFI